MFKGSVGVQLYYRGNSNRGYASIFCRRIRQTSFFNAEFIELLRKQTKKILNFYKKKLRVDPKNAEIVMRENSSESVNDDIDGHLN